MEISNLYLLKHSLKIEKSPVTKNSLLSAQARNSYTFFYTTQTRWNQFWSQILIALRFSFTVALLKPCKLLASIASSNHKLQSLNFLLFAEIPNSVCFTSATCQLHLILSKAVWGEHCQWNFCETYKRIWGDYYTVWMLEGLLQIKCKFFRLFNWFRTLLQLIIIQEFYFLASFSGPCKKKKKLKTSVLFQVQTDILFP